MRSSAPVVTIGVPIFNAERYLRVALDSLLAQDFADFEVLISDNASEDATQRICREYVDRDPRFRYDRFATNLGAVANHNVLVERARGKYFKWLAYDDYCAPSFLRLCVEPLEGAPEAVLSCSDVIRITEDDRPLDLQAPPAAIESPDPRRRFHALLWRLGRRVDPIFGLIRAEGLRRTGLIRRELGSDRLLLAELSLLGRFVHVPRPLTLLRETWSVRRGRNRVWWAPENEHRLALRAWRLCFGHLKVLRDAPLSPAEKAWLAADVVTKFSVKDGFHLAAELKHATVELAHARISRKLAQPAAR